MSAAAIAAALSAACTFATAAILQQEAAQTVDPSETLHLRLLLDLLHHPRWVAGVTVLVAGFSLQAVALANGPVALVQPIIATELVFAIPIAIWRRHRRAGPREWVGISLVLCGVSVFLVVASPAAGIAAPGLANWARTMVPAGFVVLTAVSVARVRKGPQRAPLLGVAAGVSYALLAVLTKAVTHQLGNGVVSTLTSWQIYVLVGFGVAALVISQSAYQSGPLALSMPAVDTVEPVTAVTIGDMLFDEQAHLVGASLALEVGAALVALVGIALLATSPIVLSIYEQARPTGARSGQTSTPSEPSEPPASRPPAGSPRRRRSRQRCPSWTRSIHSTPARPGGAGGAGGPGDRRDGDRRDGDARD